MNIQNKFTKRFIVLFLSVLLLMTSTISTSFAATNTSFKDISGHWAEKEINDWTSKGLIAGYEDSTFKPDNPITRAEFIALVNRSFNIKNTAQINFSDVKPSDWYYSDIQKAKAAGFISGYEDNTMRPNKSITRQEAASIISRLLNLKNTDSSGISNFKDAGKISDWAKGAISSVVKQGYMGGYPDNTFKPENFITRAETVVVLNRVKINSTNTNTNTGINNENNQPTVKAIAAGAYHTVALKNDGTVWAWGWNDCGQLGDGTTTNRTIPVQVKGISDVVAIAAGMYHTVALKNDGTVWAWGFNYYGELGNGTADKDSHSTPVQVKGISDVKAIAAGMYHTVALKNDGTVWAWGDNEHDQLGNETTKEEYHSTPVQVKGISDVKAITAGNGYTVALKNDGTVWAWGDNYFGTTNSSSTPVQVKGISDVKAIAAGASYTVVLKNDGTVWAWGVNEYGKLGDGTTNNSFTPVQVNGISNVKAIAAGAYHTVVLKNDGTVWTWGYNHYGELGNGTTVDSSTPVQVKGISDVKAIAAGACHTVALKNDGTVWAWGCNYDGELGNGTAVDSSTPVQVKWQNN
ncbi:S-layer homology domain-containing protein [Thermoanaerobacterium thermosaccharolyticum]|uniref:RCC1 domain-containing protein n=1 Tax=Thermoanaerobacterium thermosaccharolyticum TaxID=1517 RepID=UPI002FDA3A3A